MKKNSQLSTAKPNLSLPSDVTKFQADKAIVVLQEILVKARAVSCFDIIANQLEGGIQWDPMIVRVKPITAIRHCPGAVSKIILDLVGKSLESSALVTLYKADCALAWILTDHPKVKEYWSLKPNAKGTKVRLTLGYETSGWIVNRILQNLLYRRRLEKEVSRTLTKLKRLAESTD
jgi:hypothetical protein